MLFVLSFFFFKQILFHNFEVIYNNFFLFINKFCLKESLNIFSSRMFYLSFQNRTSLWPHPFPCRRCTCRHRATLPKPTAGWAGNDPSTSWRPSSTPTRLRSGSTSSVSDAEDRCFEGSEEVGVAAEVSIPIPAIWLRSLRSETSLLRSTQSRTWTITSPGSDRWLMFRFTSKEIRLRLW